MSAEGAKDADLRTMPLLEAGRVLGLGEQATRMAAKHRRIPVIAVTKRTLRVPTAWVERQLAEAIEKVEAAKVE